MSGGKTPRVLDLGRNIMRINSVSRYRMILGPV